MKQLFEALRAARKIELLVIAAVLCALLLLYMGDGEGGAANEAEARMERVLSRIEGAGRVSVMISEGAGGEIVGAVVVAGGADDLHVSLELQRAVQTLTGLELEQIEVAKSER